MEASNPRPEMFDMIPGFPCSLGVADPLYTIEDFTPFTFRIHNSFDSVLGEVIDKDRWWCRHSLSSKRIIWCGAEEVDMEDIVDSHRRREVEAKSKMTDAFTNGVWTETFPVELGTRSSRTEVACAEVNTVTNSVVRRGHASAIGLLLIYSLGP